VWDFINKLLNNPAELEILGDGRQVRSYIYIDDAVEATMIAWRKTDTDYEVYNVGNEDWITVDEVTDVIIKILRLKDVKKIYRPILHGVGWPGDVKKITLKIDKIKKLRFKPTMSSRNAVNRSAKEILREIAPEKVNLRDDN
jgi:UDP-glucose 4-epimerase